MASIRITMKDGTVNDHKHRGRAGGSYTNYDSSFYEEWLIGLIGFCTCGADSDMHDERCCRSVAQLGLEYGAALKREDPRDSAMKEVS